jgi:hypothetical protein
LKPAARRDFTKATSAVITVGDGRGFVVNQPYGVGQIQLVITAAHCLPFFPPCASASYLHERTFQNILAPLGAKPYVWAECLFVDPIGDIAVLGSPDDQELAEKAEAYCELVEADSQHRADCQLEAVLGARNTQPRPGLYQRRPRRIFSKVGGDGYND